jgi:ubiquitin C
MIQIFVKPLNGQTIVLEMDMNDTIRKLKYKINKKEGIPIRTQRLTFLANILEDKQTISHYNIQNESTLHLILRQPGKTIVFMKRIARRKI